MDYEILWARYNHNTLEIVFDEENTKPVTQFEYCGLLSRLKFNPRTNDFDIIRPKKEVEETARERGANVVARPKKGTRRKHFQGRYFLFYNPD